MGKQVKWSPPEDDEIVETSTKEPAIAEPKTQWVPPDDDEIIEPVKKKDDTTENQKPGFTDLSKPSAQDVLLLKKPTLNGIELNLEQKSPEQTRFEFERKRQLKSNAEDLITETYDKQNPKKESNIAVTAGKTAWNLMRYQIPAQLAAVGSMAVKLGAKRPIGAPMEMPVEDQKKVETEQKNIQKNIIGWANKQQAEGATFTKDLVNTLDKIEDPIDALNWITSAATQAGIQIPAAIVTSGASSFGQEVGSVYLESINRIAKEKGITPDEVIDNDLDEPAIALVYGTAAGALDYIGAGQVAKGFSKEVLKRSLRERAASALKSGAIVEPTTEYFQTWLEQLGQEQSTGKSVSESVEELLNNPEKTKERKEATAQGVIGGVGGTVLSSASPESIVKAPIDDLNKTASEVIKDQVKNTDATNAQSLDKAAAIIQAKVDQDEKVKTNPIEEISGGKLSEDASQEKTLSPEKQNNTETEKLTEDAKAIRSDSEQVPQGGTADQGIQNHGSENIQQPTKQEAITPSTEQQTGEQNENTGDHTEEVMTRTLAVAQRILSSDANDVIKNGIKEKGHDYIPKKLDITDKEAKDLIELYGEDKSESLIRDTKNDLTGDTRTALAARLYENYKNQADKSTDIPTQQRLYNKAVDIALVSANQLKEAGRQANAAKIWKAITSDEDMTVLAIEKQNKQVAQNLIQPIQKEVSQSRQQFDEEVRRIISQKVTEGVEHRLAKAKLITKEKRTEISDFFDSLKVKDLEGTANDIVRVLGATAWNGSIEAVKRAVLTGADIANAVQAGIDYLRDNHKGSFDEDEYKNLVSPHVEKMMPKEKIQASDVDESKINTPKVKGKKKKDLINNVVDAYNSGELTDEKFEELYAKQIGYREYTPEERSKIRELSKVIAEAEKFTAEVKNNFTAENIAKYKDLLKAAQKANQEMQEFARAPNNIYDTIITIMQGNLLTPLSLVTNVYSNGLLQPLRFLSSAVGSVLDTGISQLHKTGLIADNLKDKSIDLTSLQKGYFQGGWNGLMEGLDQLKSGSMPDEKQLREIQSGFSPTRAIQRWADNDRTLDQKINDYVEGTFGMPAEIMFRLLNLGDKPFRKAAEMGRAVEIGESKGLKDEDLAKFIMFPDETAQAEITKAGQEATFQQETELSKGVQKGIQWILNYTGKIPYVGGVSKVLLKSQVPYVKTPLNIVIESFDYAIPPLSFAKGLYAYKTGNKREGNLLIGKAIVGSMIIASAKGLFTLGLLSSDEDEEKKGKPKSARSLQYDTVPPNSVNISAISRGLIGQGFEIKDTDLWVNYKKMGITGIILDIHANQSFRQLKQTGKVNSGWNEAFSDMFTSAPSVIASALDQSFLKGTNSFLNAIQDAGGYESQQWAIETTGAIASVVYPNTISTISKSADEFVRDTYDKEFLTRLASTYKAKMFLGSQLPPKVNLWGEPVRGNPEGRNKFIYYLFDPTKFKKVDTDSYKYKLYKTWKDDAFNDDWLPNIPKRNVSVKGIDIPLTGEQYARFCEYIGRQRAILTQAYINTPGFDRKNKDSKLQRLEALYSKGRERGKKKFIMDMGWGVLTKSKLEKINK